MAVQGVYAVNHGNTYNWGTSTNPASEEYLFHHGLTMPEEAEAAPPRYFTTSSQQNLHSSIASQISRLTIQALQNTLARVMQEASEISDRFNERGNQVSSLQTQNREGQAALGGAMANIARQKNLLGTLYVVTAVALPIAATTIASYAYNHFFPSIPDFSPTEQNSDSLVQNLNTCIEQRERFNQAQQGYKALHSECETDLKKAADIIDASERNRVECEKNLDKTTDLYKSAENDLRDCIEALENS